jgi:rhomboid protease GluP
MDPLDLKRFFDGLGMNGLRWQWRVNRWKRSLREFFHGGTTRDSFSVTRALILVNLILFTVMVLQGMAAGRGLSPLLNPDGELMLHAGAQFWPLVLQQGQWWRCLTYAFTHGGIIHIGFNMVVLYQVGPLIEFEIGKSRYIFLYTFTALTATLAGLLWHPYVLVVGASGALFGLIGFAVAYYHRMGDPIAIQRRNFMFQWAIFAFVFGLLVGADNAGHLGGAIGGLVVGLILPIRGRLLRATDPLFKVLGTLSTVAIIYSLAMLAISWVHP